MDTIAHERAARHHGRETPDGGTLRSDMEASEQALLAADNAHLDEAMNSVDWERRGVLRRLIRRAR
jgi:hypothetical protein